MTKALKDEKYVSFLKNKARVKISAINNTKEPDKCVHATAEFMWQCEIGMEFHMKSEDT